MGVIYCSSSFRRNSVLFRVARGRSSVESLSYNKLHPLRSIGFYFTLTLLNLWYCTTIGLLKRERHEFKYNVQNMHQLRRYICSHVCENLWSCLWTLTSKQVGLDLHFFLSFHLSASSFSAQFSVIPCIIYAYARTWGEKNACPSHFVELSSVNHCSSLCTCTLLYNVQFYQAYKLSKKI